MKCEKDPCQNLGAVTFQGKLLCVPCMTDSLKDHHRQDLMKILKTMDLPEGRLEDLNWLRRNLLIKNADHPEANEALRLIQLLLK